MNTAAYVYVSSEIRLFKRFDGSFFVSIIHCSIIRERHVGFALVTSDAETSNQNYSLAHLFFSDNSGRLYILKRIFSTHKQLLVAEADLIQHFHAFKSPQFYQ